MQVGSVNVHIDAKAWLPSATASRLRASMKGIDGEAKQPGQLLKDLVEMYNKRGDPNFKIEWHFDKRSIGHEAEYLKAITDELKNMTGGGKKIRELLGFAGEKEDLWDDALDEIISKLDEGFIKIAN